MKRLSDKDRIEQIFLRATEDEALSYMDYAALIVRLRFTGKEPAKRGRKSKPSAQAELTEAK